MALTPLITAGEGFPALERLADAARDELLMSFRIFDPETRLRDAELRARGLADWTDLLNEAATRGVRLRIALSDFDPFFASDLHHLAWRSAHHLADQLSGDVQVICAPHGQSAGWLWRIAMRSKVAGALRKIRERDTASLTPVEKAALNGKARLRPVTIHQKFAVADGSTCVIGGLDINERRYDTPDHDRPPNQTWHDVSLAIEGDFCAALRSHFVQTWNAALDCAATPTGQKPERFEAVQVSTPDEPRLLRTFSAPCPGAGRLAPRSEITEIEQETIAAIGRARNSIFIETQFLRHRPVVDALAAAANSAGLQLVMILPPLAERVLFNGDYGWDARHGHALQVNALVRLRAAYGDRIALIAPAQPRRAPPDSPAIYGAGPVYVHSKVTLVDDQLGIVGSANLNGRSLRWDTEASVAFGNAATIADLRQRLARKWLGDHVNSGDITLAATWNTAAATNAALDPEARKGFVLPYPLESVKRFSLRLPLLSDDMF